MDDHVVRVGGHRLRLSNLDKVLYPETGTTKGEVVDYYTRIASALIPHSRDRPVTRKRWPDGVDHEPFFAKDLSPGTPDWVPRRAIPHSSGAKEYPLVNDLATLVYLAQTASLELHTPQWTFAPDGTERHPDRLVLDLDPGPGTGLAECATVAAWTREILDGAGLTAFPVTSGSKGIHLYVPLDGRQSSDQVSAFAKELAQALEADHPDLVTSRMAKALRPGKVFIDWSQNNGSKTTIAPYSMRGVAHPNVAAPRTWEELADPGLRQLRFDEVLERVSDQGDLLADSLPTESGPLASYRAKRSRENTPEPVPETAAGDTTSVPGEGIFVVQEHHARRLHFDLRLEHGGVLESWAVPKGIPDSPSRNHLAVMTEPHPLSYATFSGEIPKGEYGAGTMTIWDRGRYRAEKWRDDEIIFTLHSDDDGPIGTGRFALIRTEGEGEKSSWLLHRMKDSGSASEPASAPTMADAPIPDGVMLATHATPALAEDAANRWSPWVEFKWDGVRARGSWDGTRLTLRARSGTDITARYPELTAQDPGFGTERLEVDGEIVALDASGRPDFERLQRRMHLTVPGEIEREAQRVPVAYFLFDALVDGDENLSGLPLRTRREHLEARTEHVRSPFITPPLGDDVRDALAAAEELRLEGVVVKDPKSRYREGRSDQWLKVKLRETRDVIIGGWRPGKGSRSSQIGSLLVGIPTPEGLHYAGRVGTGFTAASLRRLDDLLAPLQQLEPAFIDIPAPDASDAVWTTPTLVGEIEFAGLSSAGHVRHGSWRGLRSDIAPEDVAPL